ncbi:MAG: ABC transporter ATP-binding protein/permease [Rickettsiales bacterium]|jgi:ATP-binding cassette subfamily B protein|nr:ABC transporter ATP-binding protein/permease [Rickettsiales bacterium]
MKFVPETYPLACSLIENPKTLIGFLRKNFWQFFGWGFVLHALTQSVFSVGSRLFPAVRLQMITNLLESHHHDFWQSAAIVLVILVLVQLFLDFCEILKQIIWARWVRPNSRRKITLNLINYLHCQSMDFINKRMLGKMSQQVNNIATSSLSFTNMFFAKIIPSIVTMLVGLGIIASLHWSIATIILALMIIRFAWLRLNFRNIILTNAKTAASVSQIHGATTDTLGGSANVRAFSGRIKELGILRAVLEKYRTRFINHLFAERKFWAPASLLGSLSFGLVMFLCVMYFHNGGMTLAQVVFTLGAYAAINSSMWEFMDLLPEMFEMGTETSQNYRELNARISVTDKDSAPTLNARRGAVDIKNIDFGYNKKEKQVLKNFSLSIKPGEHVGIVGASGCGKSTIFKLLMRMYDVGAGKIKIDGQNIADVSLDSLRTNIAFIPQDTSLFNRTIMENLRYAAPRATFAQVIAAAQFAGAHEFISNLTQGYNTIVGDRGVRLSGGQRQRIAIARAFLQRAPILLIDEATSALDSETEEIIQTSIYKIAHGKTMLVVAHRLSTLMKMDRIIVLDKGRIIESGTHDQLVQKRGGKYAKMWKCQQCGFIGKDC